MDGSIRVRWNACDSNTYCIYRSLGKGNNYVLLTDQAIGVVYYDEDVVPGQGYTYHIVPNEGSLAGEASEDAYYVYVDMPKNISIENVNGKMRLTWDKSEAVTHYRIARRYGSSFNFEFYDNTKDNFHTNKSVTEGYSYFYRLSAVYKEDGVSYVSATSIVSGIPQTVPVISSISVNKDSIGINWNRLKNQSDIEIWRRSENEDEFTLIETVPGGNTKYVDKSVEVGTEYHYRIRSHVSVFGIEGYSEPSNTVGGRINE